jgi:hypothetical protein
MFGGAFHGFFVLMSAVCYRGFQERSFNIQLIHLRYMYEKSPVTPNKNNYSIYLTYILAKLTSRLNTSKPLNSINPINL